MFLHQELFVFRQKAYVYGIHTQYKEKALMTVIKQCFVISHLKQYLFHAFDVLMARYTTHCRLLREEQNNYKASSTDT